MGCRIIPQRQTWALAREGMKVFDHVRLVVVAASVSDLGPTKRIRLAHSERYAETRYAAQILWRHTGASHRFAFKLAPTQTRLLYRIGNREIPAKNQGLQRAWNREVACHAS